MTEHVGEMIAAGTTEAPVTVAAHAADQTALKALAFARIRLLTYV